MSSLALLKAVTAGRPRQVRLLLDSGLCSMDGSDECGQTALIRAIFIDLESSRDKIVRILLKNGVTVGKTDVVGRDALAWACLYGRDVNVKQLLDHAAGELDLNRPDVNGQTPLFHAVASGSASTVKLMVEVLLKYDLSVDVQDVFGTSPLMLAMKLNHDVCASILIRNGKAKVGLGMKYPDDFNRAEKWAVQTMRNRSKNKRSKFPAEVFSETNNTLRPDQRNKTINGQQVVKLQLPPNSDSESSDSSDSEYSEILSIYTSGTETEDMLMYCMKFAPKVSIPSSILAVSPSLSTIVNVSSSDEVDTFSTPCSDDKKDKNTKCFSQLYGLVQDQMTTSYRLTAHPIPSSPAPSHKQLATERSDVSSTSTKRGKKGTDRNQRVHNMALKRQTTGALFGIDFPSPIQRGTTFPLLSDRRTDLVNIGDKKSDENNRTGNNNYSLM